MIIPKTQQDINIGDKVLTIKEKDINYCIITPGHEFVVIGKEKGQFICEDINNNLIINFSIIEITKKVDLKKSKNEYIFNLETITYKYYIVKKCPNAIIGYDYSDRCKYDGCKLKKEGIYQSICQPDLECVKYLKNEDINNCYELLKHLRRNKLYKLDKICLH